MVERVDDPTGKAASQSVSITLNTDEAGQRELAMDFGGAAVVLGPDLVDVLESVLTGEAPAAQQLRTAVQDIAKLGQSPELNEKASKLLAV